MEGVYLGHKEAQTLKQWLIDHFTVCPTESFEGDIKIQQSSASGIGTNTYVECTCGKRTDITDYHSW
jgi:hypothetical protein